MVLGSCGCFCIRSGVRLCPSALDGESASLVLLRWLRLASAPPCHFRAWFAGHRSRWGVPTARSSHSLLVHRWVGFRVLASWGPLLVPGSLYSPATEILSLYLGSFKVVDEGFLPPTAGCSFIGGTSACSGLLLQVTANYLAFWLATAVFRCGGGFTHGYGWSPVFPSFGSGGRRHLVYP